MLFIFDIHETLIYHEGHTSALSQFQRSGKKSKGAYTDVGGGETVWGLSVSLHKLFFKARYEQRNRYKLALIGSAETHESGMIAGLSELFGPYFSDAKLLRLFTAQLHNKPYFVAQHFRDEFTKMSSVPDARRSNYLVYIDNSEAHLKNARLLGMPVINASTEAYGVYLNRIISNFHLGKHAMEAVLNSDLTKELDMLPD